MTEEYDEPIQELIATKSRLRKSTRVREFPVRREYLLHINSITNVNTVHNNQE